MADELKAMKMAAFVREMVNHLVDNEECVAIAIDSEGDTVVKLRVSSHPDDVGKVIGKQGRHARALRTLMGAAAAKLRVTCQLDINEAGS
jgi:predicted RNA-binding protein YlqC (UPF0109 family)